MVRRPAGEHSSACTGLAARPVDGWCVGAVSTNRSTFGLFVVLLLVLAAEFTNGLTDAANAIATVVGTRVLPPAKAVLMAAVLNMAGVLVTGAAVATTIGTGVVRPEVISLETVAAGMLTVVVWTMAAWFFGIPPADA
jgi:PiT family inorganic phosphate transporter